MFIYRQNVLPSVSVPQQRLPRCACADVVVCRPPIPYIPYYGFAKALRCRAAIQYNLLVCEEDQGICLPAVAPHKCLFVPNPASITVLFPCNSA